MKGGSYNFVNNRIFLPLLAAVCVGIVLLNNFFGVIIIVIVLGLIGLTTVSYLAYLYPRYNIPILLGFNCFIGVVVKIFNLADIPLGILNDGLCVVMIVALILNRRISGGKSLPAILIWVWLLYLAIELLNPNSNSRTAGFLAIRSWELFVCSFFVMYSSISSKKDIHVFLACWLSFGFLAAVYGLWQELVNLPLYDYQWATADEEMYGLLFTWGRLRKFSFFFSPTEFGMLMSFTGVAGMITAFYAKQLKYKIMASITAFVCIWSMIYSGSRTAMAVLPVGLLILAVITLHRKVLLIVAFSLALGSVIILRPSSSALWVMSTAFSAADDPSMNVRMRNREIIRTYIQSNPIGYGLGGTGYLGHKYSPGTFIGTFATDSEFVRLAVEVGWLGLLLWCAILGGFFWFGVSLYFRPKSNAWKPLLAGILTLLFMIEVSHYTQEIFVSTSITIVYASLLGAMAKIGSKVDSPDDFLGSVE